MSSEAPETSEVVADIRAPATAEDAEIRLRRDIRERIDILTDPAYHDVSVTPLKIFDYTWLAILCAVIPIVLLIWGWFQI